MAAPKDRSWSSCSRGAGVLGFAAQCVLCRVRQGVLALPRKQRPGEACETKLMVWVAPSPKIPGFTEVFAKIGWFHASLMWFCLQVLSSES